MKIHKLSLEDIEEDLFALFAIHTGVEEHKLAYHLNKFLGLRLRRNDKDLDFNYLHASFPVFEWKDLNQEINWSLIANKCLREVSRTVSSGTLFLNNQETETITSFLIPEKKTTDYILKTEGVDDQAIVLEILKKIQAIPHIQTAYIIETQRLKSIKNLITS